MATRENIVEQSLELFLRHGLKLVRMDDIASSLGVSKRTLYEMFGNRENLIGSCVELHFEQQRALHEQKQQECGHLNVIGKILEMIANWESIIQSDINFMTELRRYYPKVYSRVTETQHAEGVETLKQELRGGVEDGVLLRGINVEFSAQVLINAINSVLMDPAQYETSNISTAEAFQYILLYFFRGIATNKGRRQIDRLFADRNPQWWEDKKK